MSVLVFSTPKEPIIVGDTWDGFTMSYKIDGIPVNLTGATIRMRMVSDTGGEILISSTGGGFIFPSPETGEFSCVKKSRMDFPAGFYNGDLEITLSSGDRDTVLAVKMFLKDDVTK